MLKCCEERLGKCSRRARRLELTFIFLPPLFLSSGLLGYLCAPEANVFDIDFVRFKIRDMESGSVLFEITKPAPCDAREEEEGIEEDMDHNSGRFVRYQFTPQFLRLRTVGAT